MTSAATASVIAAAATGPARARAGAGGGTPEQIHLTWGDDPARSVIVSWMSPGQALRPRVRIGQRVIPATERARANPGGTVITWSYHARVDGLRPGATYGYAVTADNDANVADPFSATFTTAPDGRAKFRFSCFGDLDQVPPAGQVFAASQVTAAAVGAVETCQPLFHLFNGDLAEAAAAGREFGNQVQTSAASRPWLPVPGSQAEQALSSFQARYTLPSNGVDGFDGRWYAFRVGTALFICLSDDDVAYAEPAPPQAPVHGYSGGAQTRWLAATLAAARADASVDWIVVQLHHCACSSGAGSDLGIRREWVPLFDRYEVDLVLSGHDHGYERSFPVRGAEASSGSGSDPVTGAATDTRRPHPVTTVDSGVFDTSQGTVHLVLGGAPRTGPALATVAPGPAASAPGPSGQHESARPAASRLARVFTRPRTPVPGSRVPGSETASGHAIESATWSARRDGPASYGIAVFDVNPGSEAGGQTSIIVRYYRAAGTGPDPAGAADGPADDLTLFEAFTLVRPRSDGRRWHPKD